MMKIVWFVIAMTELPWWFGYFERTLYASGICSILGLVYFVIFVFGYNRGVCVVKIFEVYGAYFGVVCGAEYGDIGIKGSSLITVFSWAFLVFYYGISVRCLDDLYLMRWSWYYHELADQHWDYRVKGWLKLILWAVTPNLLVIIEGYLTNYDVMVFPYDNMWEEKDCGYDTYYSHSNFFVSKDLGAWYWGEITCPVDQSKLIEIPEKFVREVRSYRIFAEGKLYEVGRRYQRGLYVLPILSLLIFLAAVVMFLIFKFRRDRYVRL